MIGIYPAVVAAEARIRTYVRATALHQAAALSEEAHARVALKLESLQVTGSFKARGALNKLLSLDASERRRGVVAASTGNHGLAVAHALRVLNLSGVIYLPETAAPHKIALLRRSGARLAFHGVDGVEAEHEARRVAAEQGRVFVSPYNDPSIIGGQGTVAVELQRQASRLDSVLVAVGGGGLIAGVAGYLKRAMPDVEVIGCSPEASCVMHASIQAGRIVQVPSRPTLSDATAGGIEEDACTFAPCQRLVDDWLVVKEDAIARAMRRIYREERLVVEGAAGVAVASFVQHKERFRDKRVAIVICGGNVDMDQFKALVC